MPEVFLPLKQCIEILGASLQPRSAQAILEQCLQGITQKVLPAAYASATGLVACWQRLSAFSPVRDVRLIHWMADMQQQKLSHTYIDTLCECHACRMNRFHTAALNRVILNSRVACTYLGRHDLNNNRLEGHASESATSLGQHHTKRCMA